ncbi:hypothetical protein ABH924_001440 [Arthrobacter sp. GAS37]|uniref:hypothetical protein n=1 Tax=Arthrobacter sp. GAS37 TaxID=3156261 RepID=UPI003839450C
MKQKTASVSDAIGDQSGPVHRQPILAPGTADDMAHAGPPGSVPSGPTEMSAAVSGVNGSWGRPELKDETVGTH